MLVGAVVVVIVWSLDLQLPLQSVAITTDVVSSNLDQGEMCDKVCQWFSPGPLVSSTNNTDHHDITEILLKVALNSIKQQTNKQQTCMLVISFDNSIQSTL